MDDPVDIIAKNKNNEEKIISDINSCSTNNNISSKYNSVEADILVYDNNGGDNKNNKEDDDTNTISNYIDRSNITNAVSDSDEDDDIGCAIIISNQVGNNKASIFSDGQYLTVLDWKYSTSIQENSGDLNVFRDVFTNTSVSYDDLIDDNAPSNVSIYVPVKNNYTAINWHNLNEEDLILVNATNVMKVTSGNGNNNDHDVLKFVNENMIMSDYFDGNINQDVSSFDGDVNQDVPFMNPVFMVDWYQPNGNNPNGNEVYKRQHSMTATSLLILIVIANVLLCCAIIIVPHCLKIKQGFHFHLSSRSDVYTRLQNWGIYYQAALHSQGQYKDEVYIIDEGTL